MLTPTSHCYLPFGRAYYIIRSLLQFNSYLCSNFVCVLVLLSHLDCKFLKGTGIVLPLCFSYKAMLRTKHTIEIQELDDPHESRLFFLTTKLLAFSRYSIDIFRNK